MTAKELIKSDISRGGKLPIYQKWLRRLQVVTQLRGGVMIQKFYHLFYKIAQAIYCCDISASAHIGKGLYIGHPYCITINPQASIGDNCNIHKGLTIGQENRGSRKGAPTIGNCVWIGVNVTIVGKITIGDDVLIAPNTYVNRDVPSHSVVFGNPCIIKQVENATGGYIRNKV